MLGVVLLPRSGFVQVSFGRTLSFHEPFAMTIWKLRLPREFAAARRPFRTAYAEISPGMARLNRLSLGYHARHPPAAEVYERAMRHLLNKLLSIEDAQDHLAHNNIQSTLEYARYSSQSGLRKTATCGIGDYCELAPLAAI